MSWWLESPRQLTRNNQLALKHEVTVTMTNPGTCASLKHPDGQPFASVLVFRKKMNELTLRIVLRKPTAGVDFGLQKGRGSNYEVVQKQRSTGKDLKFECTARVKTDKDGQPDFSGHFVQGPCGDRYFYIDIGTYAGQSDTCWGRRLKVPLSCITWNLIKSNSTLIADIPGAASDGGPSCAYAWLKCLDRPWQWQPSTKNKSNRFAGR